MAYNTEALLKALNSESGPQKWDEHADEFKPDHVMEYYGSDAGKSSITGAVTGAAYIGIDTKKIYLWDGTAWVLFVDLS